MATIRDHIDVQVVLNSPVAPQASFGVGLFLSDDAQIPVDQKYIVVTALDFDMLDPSSNSYKYALAYFGQKRTPAKLVIGRVVETASLPYFASGPSREKDLADLILIDDGKISVSDGTTTDDLTGIDFSSMTDPDQIVEVMNDALVLAGSTVTASLDLLDRVVFTTSLPAGEVELSLLAGVGTDLMPIFDAANGVTQAAVASQTLASAVIALRNMGIGFWNINIRSSATVDELVAFAQWVETQKMFVDFVVTDPNAESIGATSDLGFKIKELGLDRSMVIYTQRSDFPDAAANGCVLPAKEGTTSFAWEELKSVADSGKTEPLSQTVRGVLKSKGYVWIETIESNTILYDGITSGNEEKRIILGKDWYEFVIQSRIFLMQLSSPLMSFDNETMTKLEGVIKTVSDEAVARKIIVDTAKRPLTVNLPDADDIPEEQRKAHKFIELNAFEAWVNSAINDYKIVGVWNN